MKRLISLAMGLLICIVALCFVKDAQASCSLPIDDAPRIPMQERITPAVISRLSGDWYEDYVETAKFIGKAIGATQADIDREVAEAKREQQQSPPVVLLTVRANGDFSWHGKKTQKMALREWVIDLPISEGCAQIYSIDGKFYRGSREYLFVRLVNRPPQALR